MSDWFAACAIGDGRCFRKDPFGSVYIKIATDYVIRLGLDSTYVYGVNAYGEVLKVEEDRVVQQVPLSAMLSRLEA